MSLSSSFASDTELKRRSLRRNRCFATGLLVAAIIVFVGAHAWPEQSFAARLLAAAAEAAMVGGLADWFAITALFRRPLGLPIPHTALIPVRKDDIGRSLGNFVRDNFLDPNLVLARWRRENRALQIAQWLKTPGNADFVAERIVSALPPVLDAVDDKQVRLFLAEVVRERLHHVNLRPTIDAVLTGLVGSGKHMELLDAVLDQVKPGLCRNKALIAERIGDVTGRWIPQFVDRQLAGKLVEALEKSIDALGRPGDPDRLRFDRWIQMTLAELRARPSYSAAIDEMKQVLAEHPVFLRSLGMIWDEIKAEMLSDLALPSSKVRAMSAELVQTTGRLLENSAPMQLYVNAAIERILIDYITPWRLGIGNFIAEHVASWNGRQIAEIIELQVGKDLQYVRVNGTVVGAIIGVLLFLLSEGLRYLLP